MSGMLLMANQVQSQCHYWGTRGRKHPRGRDARGLEQQKVGLIVHKTAFRTALQTTRQAGFAGLFATQQVISHRVMSRYIIPSLCIL